MSAEGVFLILAELAAIDLVVSVGTSTVAVLIVGPRKWYAVILPAIATFIAWTVMFQSRLPTWEVGTIGFVVVPVGVALVQRFMFLTDAPDHEPSARWFVGGAALGLLVAFAASVSGGGEAAPLIVLIGVIAGLVASLRFGEPAVGDGDVTSAPPTEPSA